MLPKRKRKKHTSNSNVYSDVKKEYLNTGNPSSVPPLPHPATDSGSSSDEAGMSEVRLRASEKRDILLHYILENFYTIDEAHKNTLYAFLLKLSDLKAIDFDPFVQPGLYTHFRKQLDNVMLDVRSKANVQPLLQGIHSSNYNNNMVSRAAIDFETICFLGKGGFGEVIKVRNRIDGMMYALKKVRFRDLPNSAKNLEKVLREVKALAQLDHENVLRYYNAWIEVEHASEYTKKMLEAVSHKPQLPPPSSSHHHFHAPSSSPLHLHHLPHHKKATLSVEVSSEKIGEMGGEDEEEEMEGKEEETNSDSSSDDDDWMPGPGTVFGFATTSTEGEGEEGKEGEESESAEWKEESSEASERVGVEFEVVDSSESSSHAMLHGINTIKMSSGSKSNSNSNSNSTSSSSHNPLKLTVEIPKITSASSSRTNSESGESYHRTTKVATKSDRSERSGRSDRSERSERSDRSERSERSESYGSKSERKEGRREERREKSNSYSITSIHSTSSSHSNLHGINLPTTKKEKRRSSNKIRNRHAHVITGLSRLSLHSSKKGNSINTVSSLTVPPPPPLRLSSDLLYAKGKLSRSGETKKKIIGEFGNDNPNGSRTGPNPQANYSDVNSNSNSSENEKFGKGDTEDESEEWESGRTSASKNFSNEVTSNPKHLVVVPFKGGHRSPPPPPPPKNRYVLYIQMQLCESKTLKSFLDRPDRHINLVENIAMFSQIVSGLHHIHSRGLIHRDLKPDNIFFTSTGTIKIGDFGLSKHFCEKIVPEGNLFDEESSPHTMGIGTKSYASPEQIRSNFYTQKSDIYSLGIILFELFNVFVTYTERAKVLQDLRQGIIPPTMWSKYPEVARFVLRLMDDVPENRPSTSDILRSNFMTLSQGPCAAATLVEQQRTEIERLQEKIMKLEQELKLSSSSSSTSSISSISSSGS